MSDDQDKPTPPAQEAWEDDLDEIPEMGEEFFRDAWIYDGERLIRRGKGPAPHGMGPKGRRR